MYDGTMGEIRLFAGTFAPEHWLECNGQELLVADHPQLFNAMTGQSGNAPVTFRLPDIPPPAPEMRYVICARGMFPSFSR